MATDVDQQEFARQFLAQAREQGIDLVGPDRLLNRLTKNVLETVLEAEMDEHTSATKSTTCTVAGAGIPQRYTHEDSVDRDRAGGDRRATGHRLDIRSAGREKRQRRLTGFDAIVLLLSGKGLTTGEIAAPFAEVFGARVGSKDTISRSTEKVIGEMTEWQNRPLAALPGGVH